MDAADVGITNDPRMRIHGPLAQKPPGIALEVRPATVMDQTQPPQHVRPVVAGIADVVALGRWRQARPILALQHAPLADRVPRQDNYAQTPPPMGQGRLAP